MSVQVTTTKLSNLSDVTEEVDDDEYDPHENRILVNPNTSLETLLHILKGCLGTGILAMPEGFKNAGIINGLVWTILIGISNAYFSHMLVAAQYVICKRHKVAVLTYQESMELAIVNGPSFLRRLAPYAGYVVNALIISDQISTSSVYILFVGENMRVVINTYLSNEISLTYYILMLFVPFYLISCVKNLKLLASVSLLGNIICVLTYAVIGYYASEDLSKVDDLSLVGRLSDFPLFFGTAMFSLQNIGVMTTAENNMSNPKTFRKPFGVLNIGMSLITVIYIFVATIGYWRYGDNIKSSITLNFPTDQVLGQAIRVLYSLAIFVSYSINIYVVFQIFWKSLIEHRVEDLSNFKRTLVDYLHRLCWVTLTFGLAIGVPFLGLAISFIGNVNVCLLLTTFPALMEVCVYWSKDLKMQNFMFWKDSLIMLYGVLAFCAGTYSTLYEISKSYSS